MQPRGMLLRLVLCGGLLAAGAYHLVGTRQQPSPAPAPSAPPSPDPSAYFHPATTPAASPATSACGGCGHSDPTRRLRVPLQQVREITGADPERPAPPIATGQASIPLNWGLFLQGQGLLLSTHSPDQTTLHWSCQSDGHLSLQATSPPRPPASPPPASASSGPPAAGPAPSPDILQGFQADLVRLGPFTHRQASPGQRWGSWTVHSVQDGSCLLIGDGPTLGAGCIDQWRIATDGKGQPAFLERSLATLVGITPQAYRIILFPFPPSLEASP